MVHPLNKTDIFITSWRDGGKNSLRSQRSVEQTGLILKAHTAVFCVTAHLLQTLYCIYVVCKNYAKTCPVLFDVFEFYFFIPLRIQIHSFFIDKWLITGFLIFGEILYFTFILQHWH